MVVVPTARMKPNGDGPFVQNHSAKIRTPNDVIQRAPGTALSLFSIDRSPSLFRCARGLPTASIISPKATHYILCRNKGDPPPFGILPRGRSTGISRLIQLRTPAPDKGLDRCRSTLSQEALHASPEKYEVI